MIGRRVPIIRRLADGTVQEGTAAICLVNGNPGVEDFRDIDGEPMNLPSGASFEVPMGWLEELGP